MRLKKRAKVSRNLGSQTHRRGKKSNARGSGTQGGKGWSGTGKRGDQKKTLVIKLTGGNNYFGKDRALRRGNLPPKMSVINLDDLQRNLDLLVSSKRAVEKNGVYELDYTGYKILGDGQINSKVIIKAKAASVSAIEKVKKAGGNIIF